MKVFYGISTVLLAGVAAYILIVADTDKLLLLGVLSLLTSIIFLCFGIIEEHRDEIARLRRLLQKCSYGDESPEEYNRILMEALRNS